MKTYRFRPESWSRVRNRLLVMDAVMTILLGGFLAWVMPAAVREPLPIAFVLAAVGFGMWRGYRQARRQWETFELVLDGDTLTRRKADSEDFRLERAEVVGVEEVLGRSLTVKGPSRLRSFAIAPTLEGYEELAAQLREWGPRKAMERPVALPPLAVTIGVSAATIGLMALAFRRQPVIPSTIAAAILAVGLVWAFVQMRRNPHLDRKTKRMAWLAVLPAAACVVRVISFLLLGE